MASGCLASFRQCFNIGRFSIASWNLFQSLNSTPYKAQYIRCCSTFLLKCTNHGRQCAGHAQSFHSSCYLGAGHSKWKNIKHTKEAADREKGMKSNFLCKKIKVILDRNSDPDPKSNPELASLLKWARANNLTNDVFNNAIERQVKMRDPKNVSAFTGRGPSNTGIVIECFCLKPAHTKSIIQSVVKKFGFNLNVSAEDLFDYKGIIEVEIPKEDIGSAQSNPDSFPLDKYVDIAITCGAEDVSLETDYGDPYLQYICGPLDVPKVSRALGDAGLNVTNSEKTYLPKVVVSVTQEFMNNVDKLTAKLDLNNDIVKYYFNVEPES